MLTITTADQLTKALQQRVKLRQFSYKKVLPTGIMTQRPGNLRTVGARAATRWRRY